MNIKSLAEILREAAAIIHAIPCGGQPDNMRQPIVDELEGFASWVESDFVSRADYDELLLQLNDLKAGIPARDAEIASLRKRNQELQDQFEAIGAGGVKGRLMPGAVSAEPVAVVETIDPVENRATIKWPWVQNGVIPRWLNVGVSLYAAPVGNSGPLTLDEKRKILDYNRLPYDPQLAAVINQTEREVLMRTKPVQQDADRVDADRYRALASHVFEMKVTHDQDSANRIRRIRLDVRKSTQSNKRLVDDAVDNFIENLEAETQNRALPGNQGVTKQDADRVDAERLNWLEANYADAVNDDSGMWFIRFESGREQDRTYKTVREAIDAARKEAKG